MTKLSISVNGIVIDSAYQLYKFLQKTKPRFFEKIEKKLAKFVIYVVDYKPKLAQTFRSHKLS